MGESGPGNGGSSVRVRMFGPFRVETGSRRLGPGDFGRLKSKQVLEILIAARGHSVPKDQLAEDLWGEEPARNESAAIETYVSELRSDLEGVGEKRQHLVVTEHGAYRFAVEHADVDLDRFDQLLGAARGARGREARSLLKEAIDLVGGEVLEDEPHSEWARELRD